ncbi:hypothetical protein H6A03_07190 [[Clostridium] spiroforme]|nr:hypothetical protein [Thomasclavelia spiroformis]MBM6879566.1 hypothetical protein [Thomasclavelia spiroformis]
MKKYEDMMHDFSLFTEMNNTAIVKFLKDIDELSQTRESYANVFANIIENIRNLAYDAKNQCVEEKNRRERFARDIVNILKNIMSEIVDPHFHRMEGKYTHEASNCHEDVSDNNIDELMQKVSNELMLLRECVGRLNQSFIPATVSNAVGVVVPPYRKSKYKQIIESRNKILDYIEPLLDISEFEALIAEVDEAYENRIAEENLYFEQKVAVLTEQIAEKKSQVLEVYNLGLKLLDEEYGLYNYVAYGILYGVYTYGTDYMSLLSETDLNQNEAVVMNDNSMNIPVCLDSLQSNYLYICSGTNYINQHFTSLSLDLLMKNSDSEVIFIDVKGLGSEYAVLNRLTSTGHVKIWSTSSQVTEGLDELETWISSIYRENLADRYNSLVEYNESHEQKKLEKYVFINDLKANIDLRDTKKFLRIVENGKRAGVYVFAASTSNDISDKCFSGIFSEIQHDMQVIAVNEMSIRIKENAYVTLNARIDNSNLDSVLVLLQGKKEQKEIIPLGKYLPESNKWHKLCADREIIIPFGIDSNGKIAELKISSEKPYTMIIGDPRHGKSKLMHAIIMMATSRYSEIEVKIAVMDLKDGAEFNVYAKAGLKSVECVVNDEDSDAMLSFLKYYVAQMHIRQELFERMEDYSGIIIQKYEDYRETNTNIGNIMPAMPRLILMIDEFQTLFDGVSSSLYMSELVRKGATYGIHVILSSQRAISSNPRNGFTADLKDYFTSRFIFKCPQSVAKTVLSDRCADTGKENSGIHKAAMLGKGHVIYNAYMGQNESDNKEVQCFFASTDLVAQFVNILSVINGDAEKILLKKNAKSKHTYLPADGRVHLGDSVRLYHDVATGSDDYIKDNMTVSFSMKSFLKNMIVTGNDVRVLDSLIGAIKYFADINHKTVHMNILGSPDKLNVCTESQYFKVTLYQDIASQIEVLENTNVTDGYEVNLLIEPDLYEEFTQSPGGLRKSKGAEVLESVLSNSVNMFSIVYSKNFKNIRTSLQYIVNVAPVHIVSVGDYENLRMSMSENVRLIPCDFDVPRKDSIKAYYYNKDTEKYGKMIMFLP